MSEIKRDRYGRPYIIPPGGGKPVPYTRATTIAETLDDRYNLERWKMRQVASGLAVRPDLIAVAAAKSDKASLDKVCDEALEASKSGAAANLGTALHAFIETINSGGDPVGVPPELIADLDAYRLAMKGWTVERAEQMTVLDEYQIAGTPDMVSRNRSTGELVIMDTKTGAGAISYGQTAVAMQLAIYSRSVAYNIETGERTPLGVAQDIAYIVHLPAGMGSCAIYSVDLNAGWAAVEHAVWVRKWRKATPVVGPVALLDGDPKPSYTERIAAAVTVDELYAIYHAEVASGADPAHITPLCADRKRQLQSPAA